MGNESSHHRDPYSTNDFELVIRLAKELEYLLTTYFSATGNGLGDKINSATHKGQPLPRTLINPMWRLNKERNQLVHNRDYNSINDRQTFISTYEQVKQSLQTMINPPGQHHSQQGCLIS